VNGLANADAAHTKQVNQAGNVFACLKQDDVNLTSPPLAATCTDATPGTPNGPFSSHFTNAPFNIDTYIAPTDVTCPKPTVFGPANGLPKNDPNALPGGCTRDLVHRYYQELYQLHGGKQDRYMTGSDAIGLTMGYYNTKALPLYQYLHSRHHPKYAIDDNFFQGAFGGSYLNHQWLVAAATPAWTGALNDGSADDLHSVLDANGMPNNYPLYISPLGNLVRDTQLTQSCNPAANRPPTQPAFVCGNYTVNTTQPFNQPFSPGTALTRRLPPLPPTDVTIGDELSAANVDWAWYSGGWDNAAGNKNGLGWTNGSGPTAATRTCFRLRTRTTPTRSARTACSCSITSRSTTTRRSRRARPGGHICKTSSTSSSSPRRRTTRRATSSRSASSSRSARRTSIPATRASTRAPITS